MGSPEKSRKVLLDIKLKKIAMGGLCSKKKIADAETENNENEENTDKTPVGERRPTKGAGLLGKLSGLMMRMKKRKLELLRRLQWLLKRLQPQKIKPKKAKQLKLIYQLNQQGLMRMLKYLMNPYKKQRKQKHYSQSKMKTVLKIIQMCHQNIYLFMFSLSLTDSLINKESIYL